MGEIRSTESSVEVPARSFQRRVGIIVFLTACSVCIGYFLLSSKPPTAQVTERHIRYRLLARNTSSTALSHEKILLFAPLLENSTQKVSALTASESFEVREDGYQNRDLEFAVFLPPFGTKEIIVAATLNLRDEPRATPLLGNGFIKSEQFVESEDPLLVAQASEIVANEPSKPIPKALFDWVTTKLERTGYVREDRGARYALSNTQGDCTEFSYLLVALLRAQKIPARVIAGFVVRGNEVLKPGTYHNWVEYYEDGHWHLTDPFEGTFAPNPQDYLAFRILGARPGLRGSERFQATSGAVVLTLE